MRAGSPSPYVGPPPVPKMPAGLVDLVEGLTREVLKNNPKNVYEFCAKHLEKLLESRNGSSFKKPMLTLEQKIHEAQEKVRQNAKERREKYDREMAKSNDTEQPTTDLQIITVNNTSKSESDVSIINVMPPVHHEEDLKPDSEVEIAHKTFFVNEEKTYKIENVKNKEEDVEMLQEILASTVSDSNADQTPEQDIFIEGSVNVETKFPEKADENKVVENMNANDVSVNILSVTNNVVLSSTNLQDLDVASNVNEDSATIHRDNLTDENKSVPIIQSVKQENIANDNNSKKDDSLSSTNAVSDINKNISTKKSDESQRESDSLIASEPPTVKDDTKSNKDEAPLSENKPYDIKQPKSVDNIKKEENNERVVETNLHDIKEVDMLLENCDDLLKGNTIEQDISIGTENLIVPCETMSVIEDPSKTPQITNSEVISIDLNSTKESSNNDTNGNDIVVVPELVNTHNKSMTTLDKKIDDAFDKTTKVEESVDTHKNMPTLDKEIDNALDNTAKVEELVNIHKNMITLNTEIDNAFDKTAKVEEPVNIQRNMTTVIIEKDDSFDKTAKVEKEIPKLSEKGGTKTPSIELEISMTSNLNPNITEHTKENIKEVPSNEGKETPIQEKEQTEIDNPSIQVSKNSATVSDDTISLVRSDLSNIEEDTTGENQNDQNNMDLETAAVTIQKVFRTFLFKSRNSTFDDGTNDEGTSLDDDSDNINKKEEYYAAANLNKERRPLGISRMDTVLQTVNEEKSLSLSTDDSSTLSSAATTIQAHVRGFLVRNRLNSNKTVSTNSVNSSELLEPDTEQQKNKTVLNIHIVPEEGNYLSRDESIITSMELSLDGSPPSSVNLHPLSYDVSERRKLLKREDAIQSISPPSNNSGKLSEESDKELFLNDQTVEGNVELETDKSSEEAVEPNNDSGVDSEAVSISSTATATTIINVTDLTSHNSPEHKRSKSLQNMDHDESDVVTPYVRSPRSDSGEYDHSSKLVHSGEFHDALLPTRVTRNDTTVVRGE